MTDNVKTFFSNMAKKVGDFVRNPTLEAKPITAIAVAAAAGLPLIYRANEKLIEMQDIAISRGGKCLSKVYVGALAKLRWECKEGHTWFATPSNVKRGTWCPECPRSPKIHLKKKWLKKMQDIAQNNGGKCLSKVYIDTFTPLEWECAKGHRWKQSSTYLRKLGVWCPYKCRKQLRQNLWSTTQKSWGKKR